MDAATFTQSGNYTVIAGVIVILLSKIGFATDISTVLTIIGAVVGLIGAVKQIITHRKLKDAALAMGAIKK